MPNDGITPKDFLKQDIRIGDMVVYNPPYVSGIRVGKVVRFTPKMVVVHPIGLDGYEQKRFSSEVIKINEQIDITKEKYPENFI